MSSTDGAELIKPAIAELIAASRASDSADTAELMAEVRAAVSVDTAAEITETADARRAASADTAVEIALVNADPKFASSFKADAIVFSVSSADGD